MLGLFRKKDWVEDRLERLEGSSDTVRVAISNFPFRTDKGSGARRFVPNDFGNRFITELTERALPPYESLAPMLAAGTPVRAHLQLPGLPLIQVEVSGSAPISAKRFYSDLADALLDAFEKQKIKP